MIETMSTSALIAPCSIPGGHLSVSSRKAFFQDIAERSKNCLSTVGSHITGAPIGLDIRIPHGKSGQLCVTFNLPVALSLVGQGLVHGWTECLGSEKAMTTHLVRKILVEQGFTAEEVSQYISRAKATSAQLVWHIDANSRVAALDLLERAARQVKVLKNLNDDGCYGIQDYVLVNTANEVSLQIVLGSGNGIKLSIQPEYLSKYIDQHAVQDISTADILALTKTHLRVDTTIGWLLLDELSNGNPARWTITSLESCIDAAWTEAGLMHPYLRDPAMLSTKGYPHAVRIMHEWYQHYEGPDDFYENDLYDMLIKSGFDLQLRMDGHMPYDDLDEQCVPNFFALMQRDGVDLRVRPSEHKFLDGTIGKKLHRSNRWQVPEELQGRIVSTSTEAELLRGLAKVDHPPRQVFWTELEQPFVWQRLPSNSDDDWYATES